jgi:mRNA interferase MazF
MLRAGDVVELDLGLPEGSEAGLVRPAVVVTADRILQGGPNVVHVVPVTRTIRTSGSEVVIEPAASNGLSVRSAAQCQHVRAIAAGRVAARLGNVGAVSLRRLRETLALIFDL